VIVTEGVSKSNNPIQNPLSFFTELRTCDILVLKVGLLLLLLLLSLIEKAQPGY
jgi:hypothetical protein